MRYTLLIMATLASLAIGGIISTMPASGAPVHDGLATSVDFDISVLSIDV